MLDENKRELQEKYRALSRELCQNADNSKRRAESHALQALLKESDVLPPYAKAKEEENVDDRALAMLEYGRYMSYNHAMTIVDTVINALNHN